MKIRFLFLLPLLVTLIPTAPSLAAGDRFALIIGNAKYPDADSPLKEPINDSRDVADELKRDGFSVEVGENLTGEGMRRAFDKLYGKIKPGSVALLFYSGFGIQSARQSYMIPVDAQIWTEPDLRRDGFNLDAVLGEMQKRGAELKVVILDAANRNPFERRFRSFANGLAPLAEAPPNALVVYSTQPGQMLRQITTARSPFAEELVKQIGAADGVTRAVFDATRTAVAASQPGQSPWIYATLKDDRPLRDDRPAREDKTARDDRPPRDDRPARDEGRIANNRDDKVKDNREPWVSPSADAAAEFAVAKRAGTREAMERFVAKYPDGAWGERGRAELKRFEAKPAVTAKVILPPLPYSRDDERLRADLNRALERSPTDTAALYRRGQLFAVHRDYAPALADFDEVIRINPLDVEALNNRCWVRAMLDELDRALRDCNEALKLRPNFPDALDSRGLVNLKIGLPGLAIRDYDAALKGNGKQASSLYGRGMARVRTGETEEGKSDITDALRMDPGLENEFAQYGIR